MSALRDYFIYDYRLDEILLYEELLDIYDFDPNVKISSYRNIFENYYILKKV